MLHLKAAELIGSEQDVIEAYGNLQNCPYGCRSLSARNPKVDPVNLLSICSEYLQRISDTNTNERGDYASAPIYENNEDLLSISSGDSSIFDTKDTCCNNPKKCNRSSQKWQRPPPGFYDKLILIQTKIDSILYDININLFNPVQDPANIMEANKRYMKENEFLSRFIRNYLCEFKRQMRELKRLIDVRFKHQIIIDSIYQKILTMHQVVKLSLQVYAKYMPLRMHCGIHAKVKEVLQGLMTLTEICVMNDLFTDVFSIKIKINNMLVTIDDASIFPRIKSKSKRILPSMTHRFDMYNNAIVPVEGKLKRGNSSVSVKKPSKAKPKVLSKGKSTKGIKYEDSIPEDIAKKKIGKSRNGTRFDQLCEKDFE